MSVIRKEKGEMVGHLHLVPCIGFAGGCWYGCIVMLLLMLRPMLICEALDAAIGDACCVCCRIEEYVQQKQQRADEKAAEKAVKQAGHNKLVPCSLPGCACQPYMLSMLSRQISWPFCQSQIYCGAPKWELAGLPDAWSHHLVLNTNP